MNANIFVVNTPFPEFKDRFPEEYATLRDGDIYFNVEAPEVFFVQKEKNTWNLIKPHRDIFIPRVFTYLSMKNVYYWYSATEIHLCTTDETDHWIFDFIARDYIPLPDNVYMQPLTLERYNYVEDHGAQMMSIYDPEQKYFRYHNIGYVVDQEGCYEERPEEDYYQVHQLYSSFNPLPSRWGIFKALIHVLMLHKRAVVRTNHPDRLQELGVFEQLDVI